ncbi:hypothetical protein [Nonomuraea sp. NPDC049646]|uniref:hypothetical protein n=1 Tax=unclassified Nonomuraea TaxID=2593643 RepID=UPI003791E85E
MPGWHVAGQPDSALQFHDGEHQRRQVTVCLALVVGRAQQGSDYVVSTPQSSSDGRDNSSAFVDDGAMAFPSSPKRVTLLAGAAILPVAVAVASNQILNEEIWNWWWVGIALVFSVALTVTTYRLTGAPVSSDTPANDPPPSEPTYHGDHIDFGGSTFYGPVTGKVVNPAPRRDTHDDQA